MSKVSAERIAQILGRLEKLDPQDGDLHQVVSGLPEYDRRRSDFVPGFLGDERFFLTDGTEVSYDRDAKRWVTR